MGGADIAAGAIMGGKAAGKGGFFRGTTGSDSGNAFAGSMPQAEAALKAAMERKAGASREELMQDPTLAQYFGGDLDQLRGQIGTIGKEERDLATRGYSLQPEDYEAYGQSAGDLARMFGAQEQSLAQSMANRGLASSGAAGRSFAGMQGNKMERLAGLQRQIADQRMKTNMARLAQTRDFLSNLQSQQTGRMGQYTGELGRRDEFALNKGKLGLGTLSGGQEQANLNYQQRQATAKSSPFSRMLGGVLQSAGAQQGPIGGAIGGGLGEAFGSSSSSTEGGRLEGAAYQQAKMDAAQSSAGKSKGVK